jgi:hypothetical protein
VRHDLVVGRYSMPALFAFLTLIFVLIALRGATHGEWVIAVASAGIGAWMSTFAWAALRRTRR